jgi:hypothetical protein
MYTFIIINKASVHKLCLIATLIIKVSISSNMNKVAIIGSHVLKYSSRL